MAKFFRLPWASGAPANRTTIPNTDPGGGAANYTDGYGAYYSQDPAVYPATAKVIERLIINENFYEMQNAIAALQIGLPPAWISAADNDGITAYSYSKKAKVTYSGVVYESLIDSNTVTPGTDATKWGVVPFATSTSLPTATASGSNTITATFNPAPTTSAMVIIKNAASNTGAATFNPNGLGALSIVKGNNAALTGGEMAINTYSILQGNGTYWYLLNPYPISATTAANGEVILATDTTITSMSGSTVLTASNANRFPLAPVTQSSAVTYTALGKYTLTHSLGVQPSLVSVFARVKTGQTDGGFTAGQCVPLMNFSVSDGTDIQGCGVSCDASSVYVSLYSNGAASSGCEFINAAGTGSFVFSTGSKWEILANVWR